VKRVERGLQFLIECVGLLGQKLPPPDLEKEKLRWPLKFVGSKPIWPLNGRNTTAVRVRAKKFEEILMSTSAVSSSSLYQEVQSYFQARNSDVQQLGQALQSGNLSAAQSAYNNITSLGQSGPFASGNSFRVPQREQDFEAIGQALQNGDLAGAQSAYSTLRASFDRGSTTAGSSGGTQGASGGSSNSGPEIVLNLNGASGSPSSTPEQITINVDPTSSGTEQVSLSVGPEGSVNPTQFQFNLNPNSNEQIVLNLLGAETASSGSAGNGSNGLSVSA
jgi:hypothetical protein